MGGAQYVPFGMSTIWRNTFLPMRRSILTAKIDSTDHILTEQIAVSSLSTSLKRMHIITVYVKYKVVMIDLCSFLGNFFDGKRYAIIRVKMFGGIFNIYLET